MKKCPAQSGTLWIESVSSRAAHFETLYTLKAATVSLDFSISSDASRVFDILCIENYKKHFRTNLVTVRTRSLASVMKKSKSTVSRWLKELVEAKHIEKISGHGQALTYRLISPVYKNQVRVEAAVNAVAEVEASKLPILRDKKRRCPKCRRTVRITSSSGVCDSCLAEWASRTA